MCADEEEKGALTGGALSETCANENEKDDSMGAGESTALPDPRLGRIYELTRACRGATLADARRLQEEAYALMDAVARDFGRARGWKLSRASFGRRALALGKRAGGRSLETLFGWDHPYFYRERGCAVGVVAHLYKLPPNLDELAADDALKATVLPGVSWWNPGVTTAVLFTRDPNLPVPPPSTPVPYTPPDPNLPPGWRAFNGIARTRPRSPRRPWPGGGGSAA
jgi:hypothetical protein